MALELLPFRHMKAEPFILKAISVTALFVIASAQQSSARLGETTIQCADRYGPAKTDQGTTSIEKMFPLLQGAIERTFVYNGWKIRAAFLELDGPAVRIQYQKLPGASPSPVIQDYEYSAILSGEAYVGMAWQPVAFEYPNSPVQGVQKAIGNALISGVGAKAWQRSDGAIARLLPGGMILQLDLPAAFSYEQQLRAQREQKARDSVPQFSSC